MALSIHSPIGLAITGLLILGIRENHAEGRNQGMENCSPLNKLDGSLQFFLTGFSDPRGQLLPVSFGGALVRIRLFLWEFDMKWLRFSDGRKAWSPSAHGNKVYTKFSFGNKVYAKFTKSSDRFRPVPTSKQ